MKMVIWSAAMLTAAAGSAYADKADREMTFRHIGDPASVGLDPRAGSVISVTIPAGAPSIDAAFDPDNFAGTVFIGANYMITGIGVTGQVSTFGNSWIQDMGILVADTAVTNGFYVPAGFFGNPNAGQPGTAAPVDFPVTKWLDLGYTSNSMTLGADGLLYIEFYENYQDWPDAQTEGVWDSCTIYVQYVPTPGTAGLLGLAGIAALGRKRRA